jgi:uncharacterized protein (DUF849 family)
MIVQACINGDRARAFHPAVPVTLEAIVADARAVVAAGAAEVHLHVRDDAGRETLQPDVVDRTIAAVRQACPGTLIGISTGHWIERDDARRRDYLRQLSVLPDHASVNFIEDDCPAVIEILRMRGIGIEAGLWTAADARRCLDLDLIGAMLRVLIEINHQDEAAAFEELAAVEQVLGHAPARKPILLHGSDAMVWRLMDEAFARGYSTRVGLEDGATLPGGAIAPSNAALVAAALGRRIGRAA